MRPWCGPESARSRCAQILKLCKQLEIPVVVNSDAHFAGNVGGFAQAIQLLEELEFPAAADYQCGCPNALSRSLPKNGQGWSVNQKWKGICQWLVSIKKSVSSWNGCVPNIK